MKFIKKTFQQTKKSLQTSKQFDVKFQSPVKPVKTNQLQQLKTEYHALRQEINSRSIKLPPKFQVYFDMLENLSTSKKQSKIKKIQTLLPHFNKKDNKNERKQIPILYSLQKFSQTQKYQFLYDSFKKLIPLLENQYNGQKSQRISLSSSRTSARSNEKSRQQTLLKIAAEVELSLNQLKTMTLSYWTKVKFQLNCHKKVIQISGKQNFTIQLQYYLCRISKNVKNCIVLECYNNEQVPSWLRKIYIVFKKQIFKQVHDKIWEYTIDLQLERLLSIHNQQHLKQQLSNSLDSSKYSSQQQVQESNYYVFLTPLLIKNFLSEKNQFYYKIKNKIKWFDYKEIEYNGTNESEHWKQLLQKIIFSKSSEQRYYNIYQIKAIFKMPASILKFKFANAFKEKNKYISSWEVLEKNQQYGFQAISQLYDFTELLQKSDLQKLNFDGKFKQLILKEQKPDYLSQQISEVITLKSLKSLSGANHFINFLLAQCFSFHKNQKSQLRITIDFNKLLFKHLQKSKDKQNRLLSDEINESIKTIVENFCKQLVLMAFTKKKIYEQKQIDQQEFYTICDQFDEDNNGMGEIGYKNGKNHKFFKEEVIDQQKSEREDESEVDSISIQEVVHFQQTEHINTSKESIKSQQKIIMNEGRHIKKSRSLNQHLQNINKEDIDSQLSKNHQIKYIKIKFKQQPVVKSEHPILVKNNILEEDWIRHENGGLVCINEKKIKEQKKILQKILAKIGQNILKQKNIMNISLPVTIFKKQSQLKTVTRAFMFAPYLLEPQCFHKNGKIDYLERMRKLIVYFITCNYTQINFQKPFNPILGQTAQYWIDGCPVYFEQVSHHPQISSFYMLGRDYKIYGSMEPKVSMGMNHAKVINCCHKKIVFNQNGSQQFVEIGPNRMIVNGTVIGQRTFNICQKNFIFDKKNNFLTVVSFGPNKKGFFSNSSEPLDYFCGRILKMKAEFAQNIYINWRQKLEFNVKKQWIEEELATYEGFWTKYISFDGESYFSFDETLPYEIVEQPYPLPSDSRYRSDLIQLIKGNIEKSQQQKQRMQDIQRHDKKLRTDYKKS